MMDDEQMNRVIADQLPGAFAEGERCPPPEIWAAVLNEDIPQTQRLSLQEHADGCRRCETERLLARRFLDNKVDQNDDVDWIVERLRGNHDRDNNVVVFPSRWQRAVKPLLGLAAAAMLVLAFAPMLPVLNLGGAPDGGRFSGVLRGADIELLEPVGALSQMPAEFLWQPVRGAAHYRVSLIAVDGEVLWQTETDAESSKVEIPDSLGERLHRSVVYYWEVEGFNSDGDSIARSARNRFRGDPR